MLDAYIIDEIRKREAEKRNSERPRLHIERGPDVPKPKEAEESPESDEDERDEDESEPGVIRIKLT